MTPHYDIIQGTEEWHEIKWGKIGGTRSKNLQIDSDTLMIHLLSEITERFEMDYDSYESSDMIRGRELESLARAELGKYLGVELHECGWLECSENSLLGISVDGITLDHRVTAEIKCPAKEKHMSTILSDEIPLDNINQSLHYFTVNPHCERHFFSSFRPESIKKLFVKELTRQTLVNIGTKAKPIMMTVQDAVNRSLERAELLKTRIDQKLLILNNKF